VLKGSETVSEVISRNRSYQDLPSGTGLEILPVDISNREISNRDEGAGPDVAAGCGLRLLVGKNLLLDNPDKPAGIVDEVCCVFPV
jgi:hypothetical protein